MRKKCTEYTRTIKYILITRMPLETLNCICDGLFAFHNLVYYSARECKDCRRK